MGVSKNTRFQEQIKRAIKHYEAFMGNVKLPKMKLTPMDSQELKRELAWATVKYDPSKDKYDLLVWDQLLTSGIGIDCSYLLFHEFTHALDIARYGAGNQDRYNSIRGYLEYHAAQVEMAKLLNRASFAMDEPFSMNDSIVPIDGKRTVHEYIEHGLDVANERISNSKARPSIPMLFSTVGTLYNHLGRLSYCEMAATDYGKFANCYKERCRATDLFDTKTWRQIRCSFNGLMTEELTRKTGELYLKTLYDLFRQYGL